MQPQEYPLSKPYLYGFVQHAEHDGEFLTDKGTRAASRLGINLKKHLKTRYPGIESGGFLLVTAPEPKAMQTCVEFQMELDIGKPKDIYVCPALGERLIGKTNNEIVIQLVSAVLDIADRITPATKGVILVGHDAHCRIMPMLFVPRHVSTELKPLWQGKMHLVNTVTGDQCRI